jgi:lariat debranching enzyme
MKVAVVGCGHGSLDLIYNCLAGSGVDLLIVCGDFEACRNEMDLSCLAGPAKYHILKDYWKYYKGEAEAPVLTLFVGGNHEASNHLWELYYGGWVAPNIYFLGYSGVVNVGDLRIGGISGIHYDRDYRKGHMERLPYSESYLRSIYHTRECEVWRMKHLKASDKRLDIMISHDWPLAIEQAGDWKQLIRVKPHFEEQIFKKELGSPPLAELLREVKPRHWVAGHMHVKFIANYVHDDKTTTRFTALSKAIPSIRASEFLDILDFPDAKMGQLRYDEEWLAILRASHDLHFFGQSVRLSKHITDPVSVKKHREEVKKIFAGRPLDAFVDPAWFDNTTVPTHPLPTGFSKKDFRLPKEITDNSQSQKFIALLGLPFPAPKKASQPSPASSSASKPPSLASSTDFPALH